MIELEVKLSISCGNKRQQEQAFEKVFNKYNSLVWTIAFSILDNIEDSKEVTIDTFVQFFNLKEKILDIDDFKIYLISIAKRLSFKRLLKDKNNINSFQDYDDNNFYETYLDNNNNDVINFISNHLNKRYAFIFIEHVIYEQSFKDIAVELKTSVYSVSSQYFRAKRILKKAIEEGSNEEIKERVR